MSKLWQDQLRQTTFAGDLAVWRPHGVPTRSPVTTLLLWVHTVEDDLREIVSFSQSAAVWPCQQVQFDSKCFPPSNRLSIVLFTDGGSVTSERSTFLGLGRRTSRSSGAAACGSTCARVLRGRSRRILFRPRIFIGLIPRRWITIAATQWQFLATGYAVGTPHGQITGENCLPQLISSQYNHKSVPVYIVGKCFVEWCFVEWWPNSLGLTAFLSS